MKTKLNNVIKLAMLFLMFTTAAFSQSITNTLGAGGLFLIKDATTNYMTLIQSTGQVNIIKTLRLENSTSSSLGNIFKGPDRFLHNFGISNTFLGVNTGNFTLSGAQNNTGIGYSSLFSLTTGDDNTALGFHTLHFNTVGSSNTAFGYQSLYTNTSGADNTAIGYKTLELNTQGLKNAAFGFKSLASNTTGDNNSSMGYGSMISNTTGNNNTGIGYASLNSNTSGNNNTAVGYLALLENSSGTQNTAMGNTSGSSITTGDNLTSIGYDAEPTTGAANNQITLGNNQVTSLRCNVQTITSLSDMRDKKNITDLSLGLDFLMKVKPRLFNWDKREWYENNTSDGSKVKKTPTAGFIAQELDEVQKTENAEWLDLVLKDNPEKIEASYGNLLPVMVKAIQELKVENEKLKAESEKLKVENIGQMDEKIELNQRLLKLEKTQSILVSELQKFKLRESDMSEVTREEQK